MKIVFKKHTSAGLAMAWPYEFCCHYHYYHLEGFQGGFRHSRNRKGLVPPYVK